MSTTSIYPCAQSALYPTVNLIIGRLRENIGTFGDFKAYYTEEKCDELALVCSVAQSLPNNQARMLRHETARIELLKMGKNCRNKWQRLKRYIAFTYPDATKENLDAAGWELYADASNDSFDKLQEMMTMGRTYIGTHITALEANENMPVTFADAYAGELDAFNLKYTEFLTAQQDAKQGTTAKIDANNDIYSSIIEVCNDAAVIYPENEDMRELFTFSAVCSMVAPGGASTLVITVINDVTNQPMIADIIDTENGRTITTDSTGQGEMGNLAAGDTIINVTADGFTAQNVPVTLSTSTTTRIEVRLVPMFSTVGSEGNGAGNVTQPAEGNAQPVVNN